MDVGRAAHRVAAFAAALVVAPLVAGLTAPAGAAAASVAPSLRLLDRTAGSGLSYATWSGGPDKDHILESAGNGLAAVDYDGDGWDDLYLVSAWRFDEDGGSEPHSSRLYRNRRDLTFADVTARAGATTSEFAGGVCAGDYDADGLVDLYVTALGPDVLLRNNGDGTFSRATAQAGIVAGGWSTGAAFFDANGDGDQDLFVAAYVGTSIQEAQAAVRHRMWQGRVAVLDGPRGLPGDANRFFRNLGDGTFREATAEAGFAEGALSYAFAVVAFDHDGDGDQDLYVANDSQANGLYENLGDGTFRERALAAGLGFDGNGMEQGSMGLDVGDYDGDLLPDVVVTNFARDAYTLYRNLGGGLYLDASFDAGIAVPTFTPLGWGALLLDVDQDADLDLFFANGHLYAQVDEDPALAESYRQRNQLLVNDGGRFTEATEAGDGLEVTLSSRGAVASDLDHDGDLDLVVSNQDAPPTLIENATIESGHWIALELTDTRGDRMALGARIEIAAGGVRQVRWIRSGGSYLSQSTLRAHFGLGEADRAEAVAVRWPDGEVQETGALAADRAWRITRGRPPRALASR